MAYEISAKSVSLEAAGDLSTLQYQFCLIDSNGQVTSGGTNLTAQGQVDGIIGEGGVDAAGKAVNVIVPDGGIAMIKLGATLSAGAEVATAADGRAVAVGSSAGDRAWGTLLEGGAANEIVAMQFGLKNVDPGT